MVINLKLKTVFMNSYLYIKRARRRSVGFFALGTAGTTAQAGSAAGTNDTTPQAGGDSAGGHERQRNKKQKTYIYICILRYKCRYVDAYIILCYIIMARQFWLKGVSVKRHFLGSLGDVYSVVTCSRAIGTSSGINNPCQPSPSPPLLPN